jgi:iron complex transport system substrate-binding protein
MCIRHANVDAAEGAGSGLSATARTCKAGDFGVESDLASLRDFMNGFAAALALGLASQAAAAPRIFSTDQCADQYVLALAPRAEIVGLSKRALNDDSDERARAVGLPERRPTLEAILGARATLVVNTWAADTHLPTALARRGVGFVQIDGANDFPAIRSNIRKVAAALGERPAGEALIARTDGKLAAARDAWRGASALYLTPTGFTAGRDTLMGAMMAAAGLKSLAGPSYASVPLEKLVLNPPSALVLGFFRDLQGGRQHWTIGDNAYLQRLARERAIASLPGSMLGCPTWAAADGALMLARAHAGRGG